MSEPDAEGMVQVDANFAMRDQALKVRHTMQTAQASRTPLAPMHPLGCLCTHAPHMRLLHACNVAATRAPCVSHASPCIPHALFMHPNAPPMLAGAHRAAEPG